MKPNPRGAATEAHARDYLIRQGLRILASNFHCRWGEIDLIAEDRGDLVFVEVRRRSNPNFGGALASVGPRKQQRLRRAALTYLQRTAQSERACRFDVLGFDAGDGDPSWIKNAFEA